jgi:hypothetical protein
MDSFAKAELSSTEQASIVDFLVVSAPVHANEVPFSSKCAVWVPRNARWTASPMRRGRWMSVVVMTIASGLSSISMIR